MPSSKVAKQRTGCFLLLAGSTAVQAVEGGGAKTTASLHMCMERCFHSPCSHRVPPSISPEEDAGGMQKAHTCSWVDGSILGTAKVLHRQELGALEVRGCGQEGSRVGSRVGSRLCVGQLGSNAEQAGEGGREHLGLHAGLPRKPGLLACPFAFPLPPQPPSPPPSHPP